MSHIHQSTAIALSLWFAAASASTYSQESSVPLKSSITQVQPMTGIVLWNDNEHVEKAKDAIALEYRYCGYNEIVQPDGTYDFSKLDGILDDIAGRNHQAILRFYFCYVGKKTTVADHIRKRPDYHECDGISEGKKTYFCDWSNTTLQDFTLEFYSKFAKRYDNDPRIAFLQTGFGLWAEYHIYDGPKKMGKTFPSKAFQTRFLKHLDKTFKNLPWSISIDAADYDYTPLEDNKALLALNFGAFDDSFLCEVHPKENAVNWNTLDPNRWKRQPAGGEFSYYTDHDQEQALSKNGPHGVPFAKAARQFHISYIIGNDQLKYRTMKEIRAAANSMGYRFKVTSAVRSGDTLNLTVTNTGVAPIYRDAWFAARANRSKTSLRGLLPGKSIDCVIRQVTDADTTKIEIQSDSILRTQTIQFEADL